MSQSAPAQAAPSTNPKDLPKPLLWGLGIGLVAFVVEAQAYSEQTVNGVVTECSYTDFAALLAAVVCVGCAVAGGLHLRRTSTGPRVSRWMILGVALGLVLLAGIHVLRGIGAVGGMC